MFHISFFYFFSYQNADAVTTTTSTTTMEPTTEIMSTEPQFEFITFNPEFNNEIPSGDSYLNRPHLNVAYSTSRAAECSFHNMWVIAIIMSLTKLLIMLR